MSILQPGKLPPDLLGRLLDGHQLNDERVLIGPGIGKDSAALSFGETALVLKSDPITFPTDHPATHLLHVNANDLVCQGATPKWLLVTALLPHGTTTENSVSQLFRELHSAAETIGVAVIGGHTEVALGLDRLLLVGTMLGEADVTDLIDPAAAQPGDRLLITKSAGIEGTALLAAELSGELLKKGWSRLEIESARDMLTEPGISVLPEALALNEAGAVTALHDPTEGGVASALREMAIAANCGAFVNGDLVPVDPRTRRLCDDLAINPFGLLASGSLLAAVPMDRVETAERALAEARVQYAWIGKLTPPSAGFRMRTGIFEGGLPEFATDEVARLLSE